MQAMPGPTEISRHTFFQGLLLAARAEGAPEEFDAEGRVIHDAFGAVVAFLQKSSDVKVVGLSTVRRDPVFGVFHEANELLLQAEQDLILGFVNPTLRKAQFKLAASDADVELKEFAHAKWLREAGRAFADALKAAAADAGPISAAAPGRHGCQRVRAFIGVSPSAASSLLRAPSLVLRPLLRVARRTAPAPSLRSTRSPSTRPEHEARR